VRKYIAAILLNLILVMTFGASSSHADTATFKFTNKATYYIYVRFFSQNRNVVWPGSNRWYVLDDDREKEMNLRCNSGEKICYGAAYEARNRTYWGVGLQGNKRCTGCCIQCNQSHAWNLFEAGCYEDNGEILCSSSSH
jgi:hypothetical protein